MKDEKKREVLKTKDYSIFKRLEGNRTVDESRVQKIIGSIESIGYVPQPIIVNEKMQVIDGQGRLEALKRMGMPVEYIVCDGATIRQSQFMNATSTLWGSMDYINSYAENGSKSYQRLQQMMTMYSVDIRTLLRLMNMNTNGSAIRMMKEGTLFVSNDDFGKGLKRLPIYSAYIRVMKRFAGNAGIKKKVIFYLIDHGGYPHQQIIDTLTKCNEDDIICSSDERLIMSIEDVYNKFKRDDKKIYFLADYRRKK